jgi:hypothetical protein
MNLSFVYNLCKAVRTCRSAGLSLCLSLSHLHPPTPHPSPLSLLLSLTVSCCFSLLSTYTYHGTVPCKSVFPALQLVYCSATRLVRKVKRVCVKSGNESVSKAGFGGVKSSLPTLNKGNGVLPERGHLMDAWTPSHANSCMDSILTFIVTSSYVFTQI